MVEVFGSPARLPCQALPAPGATRRDQHPLILEPDNQLTGEGQETGRTAAGEPRDIGGDKNRLAPHLDENRSRLGPENGNRRLRAMHLPVSEQGDGAFVARI